MNPLTDVIPPRARKYVYAAVSLAALCLAGWEASQGEWTAFAAYIIGGLSSAMASSNTDAYDAKHDREE